MSYKLKSTDALLFYALLSIIAFAPFFIGVIMLADYLGG